MMMKTWPTIYSVAATVIYIMAIGFLLFFV